MSRVDSDYSVYCRYTAVYEPFFNNLADPPGFEPESEAPETPIISRLYHGSNDHKVIRFGREKV